MNQFKFTPSPQSQLIGESANATRLKRLSGAIMIALATVVGVPASLAQDTQNCRDNEEGCEGYSEKSKGMSGWTMGGIAALLGVGAAAGGGGSDGNNTNAGSPSNIGNTGNPGNTGGGNTGNNGGTPTGGQGGNYAAGSVLTGSNQSARWEQNVVTRIQRENIRNNGQLSILAGGLVIEGQGELDNRGELNIGAGTTLTLQGEGELDNRNSMLLEGATTLGQDASIENFGNITVRQTSVTLSGDSDWDNEANASLTLDGSRMIFSEMAEFENLGRVVVVNPQAGGAVFDISTQRLPGENDRQVVPFDNRGSIQVQGDASLLRLHAASYASVGYNRVGGSLSSTAAQLPMIVVDGAQARFINQGTITVSGDGAVAMSGRNNAVLINEGTINLGSAGGVGRGMIAMQSDGSAQLRNSGTINIHAQDSYAFGVAGGLTTVVTNTGRINLYGNGSGHYAPAMSIPQYIAASTADGSVGQLNAGTRGAILENAAVDTGFTAGTAAKYMRLEDAFVGDVAGLDRLSSTSVVWQAQAISDAQGNIDIEMVKRDYVDFTRPHLASVAGALDVAYTNSALFRSLELESAQAVNDAINQLSGSGLASGTARAVGAGQSFWATMQERLPASGMYATGFGAGLSSGWGPQGNGSAVGWVSPGRQGRLDLQAGLLNHSYAGAGRDAQDRLDSRYFGMGWSTQWRGLEIRHALGSESHRLESTRSLRYGQVHQQARSERDIKRHTLSSFASRSFTVGGSALQPRLGASVYRQKEAGFSEQAAAFGLSVGAGNLSGVDLEAGLGFRRMVGAHWSLSGDAALIRPLSYSASLRQASFHDAPQVEFSLPSSGRDGVDYRLSLGADHWRGNSRLHLGADLQRTFGERDQGVTGSWSYLF